MRFFGVVNTRLICALVVRFVMSDYQRDPRPRLSLWLTMAWVGLCDMSLGLWCAGVELGDGGRRRGEGQVGTCRVDGPRVVKGGREAWTEGPRGRVTSCGDWHLGHRQAQMYMGVTILIESRRRTCKSSRVYEDLADGRSRTAVTRVEWRGSRIEYTTRGRFGGLGLKTIVRTGLWVWALKPRWRFRGETDGTWRHRGVRVKANLSHKRHGGRRMKITSS
jgi:hypothetical protein